MTILFGRLEPSQEKQDQNDKYQIRQLGFAVPEFGTVDVVLPYPNYINQYNQGNIGACTGYSASWMSSINNSFLYNAYWLYKEGQKTDGDPNTSGDNDGGYVWAVMDVLRKSGHRRVENGTTLPVNKDDGILSYYWAKTFNDLRAAIMEATPRVGVFGINWYEEFSNPKKIGDDWYIGTSKNWGKVQGGHAIVYFGVSDKKLSGEGAVALLNSWGPKYAPPYGIVWLPYSAITRLFSERGECAIGLDYIPASYSPSSSISPSPSASSSASPSVLPPESKKVEFSDLTLGKKFTGTLYKEN